MSLSPPSVTEENWATWKNESQLERPITKTIVNSMCIMVCLLGLVGNGIVSFLLGFRIQRSKFTVYILNLALADFLFLLFTLLIMIVVTVFIVQPQTTGLRQDLNGILKFMATILLFGLFGYNASLYLLTAISVERCLSVLFPIWYQCRRPKHQSTVVCSLLWILSTLVTAAEFFVCDKRGFMSEDQAALRKINEWCKIVYYSIGLLNFLVFTPIMVLSSLTLLIKVKRDSLRRQPSKLYLVIVATVVLFLIFALPIRLMLQVEYMYQTLLPMFIVDMSSLLCSINSSVNPFIYWIVGRCGNQSGSFQVILQRVFREDAKEQKQQHLMEATGRNGSETEV